MSSKNFSLAMRLLRREWRSGELVLLAVALVIAVTSLTSVGTFTKRMEQAMSFGANELLAADLRISSPNPVAGWIVATAAAHGLEHTATVSFRSVVVAASGLQLGEVKAVRSGYPLRGALKVATTAFGEERTVASIPGRGEVWLDSRLLSILGVALGDTVELGEAAFEVAEILTYEPDRGGDLFNIAPRVLMRAEDLPATGLVQPGSRIRHRLLLAGTAEAIAAFRASVSPRLAAQYRLEGVRDARPELRAALARASQFLSLAAVVSVLVAGVAIAVAARRHAARHTDAAALMRCLGASQKLIVSVYTIETLCLGLAASLAGCVLGLAAQSGLAALLGHLLVGPLPRAPLGAFPVGVLTGLVILAGFALPPILDLGRVPPADVLRRERTRSAPMALSLYGAATASAAALILWQAGDAVLAGYVIGGGVAAIVTLALAAYVLLQGLSRLRPGLGIAWRFGLANIVRRANASVVQTVALGLGIMMLLLLGLVRNDLLAQWKATLPATAPNYFLVNIQPDEVPRLERYLAAAALEVDAVYPMVRGRLRSINARSIKPADYADERAQRLVARDFNLSWSARLAPDNRIVEGSWWSSDPGARGLSIEAGIAKELGIALGDTLTFDVAGSAVSAPITSIRSVEWDSFRANFFVLASPGLLDTLPATYMTNFYLAPLHRDTLLPELVAAFPTVTVLDVHALLDKIREIMDQATLGAEYVFLFTVIAGLAVLAAAVQATLDERRREVALLRALGANRRHVYTGLLAEFLSLGLVAGLSAALAAAAVGAVLATRVFELEYRPDASLWLLGAVGGAVAVVLVGLLGTRSAVGQPPAGVLRQ